RSKTGCQQCRQRKRKCDETHPRCTSCIKRGLSCNWQPPKRRSQQIARRRHAFNKDFAVQSEMRSLITVFALPPASVQDRLMSHFRAKSPRWLSASGGERSEDYLGLIIPVAIRNPVVLNCILALAAGDMCKYEPASSNLLGLTHGFYGQAVAGINAALSKQNDRSENTAVSSHLSDGHEASSGDDVVLAIILLCVHEAVNYTHSDRLIPHVNAVAALCSGSCEDAKTDSSLRAITIEIFCYFAALISFSHGRELKLDLASHIFNSPTVWGNGFHGTLLVHRCREIFSTILKVSVLIKDTSLVSTVPYPVAVELRKFESQLLSLSTDAEHCAAKTHEDTTSELYRLACLAYIKLLLTPTLSHRSLEIQLLVRRFVVELSRLPSDSPANNILCWPMVVIGLCSVMAVHRRDIGGRLRRMHETSWRSDIVSRSAEFLSQRWKED
ncbi:hypothetical protein K456DRAFT_1805171, partial [Colletotrichum gloeosporioides 23]